jgi:hypothetical protein
VKVQRYGCAVDETRMEARGKDKRWEGLGVNGIGRGVLVCVRHSHERSVQERVSQSCGTLEVTNRSIHACLIVHQSFGI